MILKEWSLQKLDARGNRLSCSVPVLPEEFRDQIYPGKTLIKQRKAI
jgi:hypothetical protein